MKDNVIDMLFCFCKFIFKTWRNYYHDHSVNLLPLKLLYRLQYGAFFKDTFLVICNWCCTVIVAQNILFLQKLHPSLLIKIHYDSQTKCTKLPLQVPTRTNPSPHRQTETLYQNLFSCESTFPPGCCFFSLSAPRL